MIRRFRSVYKDAVSTRAFHFLHPYQGSYIEQVQLNKVVPDSLHPPIRAQNKYKRLLNRKL